MPATPGPSVSVEVVDGAQEGVLQPVAKSTSAAGFRGGGGGLSELVRWRHAVETALEALYLSTNYVNMCAGAWAVMQRSVEPCRLWSLAMAARRRYVHDGRVT